MKMKVFIFISTCAVQRPGMKGPMHTETQRARERLASVFFFKHFFKRILIEVLSPNL